MNIFRISIALLFCNVALSQISLQTNLPPSVAPNTTLNLEVKISKGSISSFSKYQLDVPAGVTISEAVSKTGNFNFDAPRAKLVWVNLPSEPEFVVKFIMNTGSVTGPGVFNQKLFYVDESGKKEFEAEPVNVTIDPSGASTTTSFPETSVASNNTSSSVNTGTGSSGSESSGNTVASSGSSGSSNSTEGGTSGTSSTTLASSGSSGNNNSGAETKTKESTSGSGNSGSSSGNSGGIAAKKENPPAAGSSSGLVYKVQLGAYGADPGKARFSGAGKVTISKEDGLYKVVTGKYNTKEEAIQANEALKSKGFNGFIVKYQNGVRVK